MITRASRVGHTTVTTGDPASRLLPAMTLDMTRKRFVETTAAAGGALAIAGPLSALQTQTAHSNRRPRTPGYGELFPTKELDSGIEYLALPNGFSYRLISRAGDPMTDGNPTPGIFDGMAAYRGRGGDVVLIRNHENRSRGGEVSVVVPAGKRYDPDPNVRGDLQLRLRREQRDAGHRRAARIQLRGAGGRDHAGHPAADHRRGPLLA